MHRLVNLAGFWMAVFSLAGLAMLYIAGPIVQKRMSRHVVAANSVSQQANPTIIANPKVGNRESQQGAGTYSLTGLRWTLAGFLIFGVVWTSISIVKTRFETPGC